MKQNKNETQDPNQLSRKNGRRAKIAAWTLGLPGVFGVAAGAANAHPNSTKIEHAATGHEVLNPQAFIDKQDKKIIQIKKDLKSSPHLEVVAAKKLDSRAPADRKYYSIWAPSKQDPNHFDFLIMAISNEKAMPDFTMLIMDADSNNWHHVTNEPTDYYISNTKAVVVTLPNDRIINPDFVQVVVPFGSGVNGYCANADNNPTWPQFGKAGNDGHFQTSTQPIVSGEFDKFFGIADEILASANQ